MFESFDWPASLHLEMHVFHADREAFDYEVETYPSWVWLALERGRFWFRLGRGKAAVEGECNVGDWVLCPPGEPLRRRMLARSDFHYARFSATQSALGSPSIKGTLRDSRVLHSNFTALRETGDAVNLHAWKTHLLLDILRRSAWERQNQPVPDSGDPAMREVRALLEAKSAEKISLAQLAQTAHLSAGTFSKRFRAAVGVSPQEFLLRQRLNHARTLLLETDLTLDAVARQTGFANGFYLSRLWTKRYGVAPARFRHLHRF